MDYRSRPSNDAYQSPTAGQPVPPHSSSLIRDAITATEQTLSELHDAINQLEQRLDTALTPASPAVTSADPSKQPVTSHIHGRVRILNEGFSRCSS